MKIRLLATVLAAAVAGASHAATYYVDYEGGSDANAGTSASAAWKYAPGDPGASGNADITPSAGDTVLLKGGVAYKGALDISCNGASGNPVVYKGDGWGTDKAVIDCSEPVTGWTRCTSADDAGGNGNWEHIWYTTDVPSGVTALEANLFIDDSLLQCAQYPNLNDIFWMDDRSTYLTAASASGSALTSDALEAIGSSLTMGYAYLDASGNNVYVVKISAFNGTNLISYSTSRTPTGKFAIANCISDVVMDREGEYVYDESAGVMYLWPWNDTDPNTVTVTASVREHVMQFNASSNVTFEGVKVVKSTGCVSYSVGTSGLSVRNCDFHHCRSQAISNILDLVNQTDLLVEGCTFWRNARMRGVVARRSGSTLTNCAVKNNSFVKIGRTAVFLYEVAGGEISGNTTLDGRGVHSNAYSCYSDHDSNPCTGVLIRDNTALNSNNSLTFYGVDTMLIVNNLFDGTGSDWPVSCWDSGNSLNVTMYHNNFVNSGTNRCGFFALPDGSAELPTAVIRNNIIDGMPDYEADVSHNLYTMMAVGQIVGETGGIINFNKALIFSDYANGDWSPAAGSPAIDAGTDVGVTEDINGTARPLNGTPDIGCFEYDASGVGTPVDGGVDIGGLVVPNPVRAMAGAVIVERAVLERGAGAVRLFTMAGQPVRDLRTARTGHYLLRYDGGMRRIVVVE